VGAAILKKGGNAVDAAIAVGLVQAVSWPEAGNIGGGGFMLIRPANGQKPIVIDYRETAPAAATKDLFVRKLDYFHITTAGVPGTVRGFALAHQKYGKLPWKELIAPAVQLAREGVTVNAALAKSLNSVLASASTKNPEFRRIFGKADPQARWQPGDILKQPELADTLQRIAESGPAGFYEGKTAELITTEMKAAGGLITAVDLKKYTAIERQPIRTRYRDYEVLSLPPPSSGGTTLTLALNILEGFEVKKHPWGSPETTHLVAEAMKRAYVDRARHLGDPAFTQIPAELLTKKYAAKLARTLDLSKATPSADLAPDIPLAPESEETTHYSVIDADGLAVSNTYTLENSFGCRIVVRGAGFILNNEMTDFNPRPGSTTRQGQIGTEPNVIAPGKRMLSSQCPIMLEKDGKLVLITGSPGGRTIINTVLSIVLNVVDYGADARQAVDAPRMHHQWFPDKINLEDRPGFDRLAEELKKLGHTVEKRRQGDAHTIAIDPKTGLRTGAADRRLDGKALGVDRK
jgi:gamma-glutamyltranspeptidase/glutathione hydrolase